MSRQRRLALTKDEQLLIDVCVLWSRDPELKSKEIAKRLKITETAVTTLVKRGKDLKYIRRVFTPPVRSRVSDQLSGRLEPFGIRQVQVVPGGIDGVGHLAARMFEERCSNGDRIVLDGGRTVAAFVQALKSFPSKGLTVTPIAADPASYPASAFELTLRFAGKCPEEVRLNRLPSWSDGKLKQKIQEINREAQRARFVFIGIGPWQEGFTALDFVEHLGLDAYQLQKKYAARVAAAVGYCFIDERGKSIEIGEINSRMPRSLKLADLKRIAATRDKSVVLMAAGANKSQAIRAATFARAYNTLLVDDELGAELSLLD